MSQNNIVEYLNNLNYQDYLDNKQHMDFSIMKDKLMQDKNFQDLLKSSDVSINGLFDINYVQDDGSSERHMKDIVSLICKNLHSLIIIRGLAKQRVPV